MISAHSLLTVGLGLGVFGALVLGAVFVANLFPVSRYEAEGLDEREREDGASRPSRVQPTGGPQAFAEGTDDCTSRRPAVSRSSSPPLLFDQVLPDWLDEESAA